MLTTCDGIHNYSFKHKSQRIKNVTGVIILHVFLKEIDITDAIFFVDIDLRAHGALPA